MSAPAAPTVPKRPDPVGTLNRKPHLAEPPKSAISSSTFEESGAGASAGPRGLFS